MGCGRQAAEKSVVKVQKCYYFAGKEQLMKKDIALLLIFVTLVSSTVNANVTGSGNLSHTAYGAMASTSSIFMRTGFCFAKKAQTSPLS